jgi:uncharacterized oligopeptide transporter (OPT) family protein
MSSEHITDLTKPAVPADGATGHQPYVPNYVDMPEFTWPAVLVGAILGIIFGASSLYLVLKVGLTVSASVPIAVLSITLFRFFSKMFGFRPASILENNIVQTTGSAGESIAFGVGVTMPVLLLLGFEMDVIRVMTVAVLGGLLGILMMIPLRKAFIVKQHGKLKYPEGTACAEVLIAGEKGGATARMVFIGFGIAFVHKFLSAAGKLWATEPSVNLYSTSEGSKQGLKGAAVGGELSPELLGVGYLIGPRIACMMISGAVLSYFVIGPLIATFGERLTEPVAPATSKVAFDNSPEAAVALIGTAGQPWGPIAGLGTMHSTAVDKGLITNMSPGDLRRDYLLYIGAGAVAAGGIISMLRALPLIISSVVSGLRDLRASRELGREVTARTERDLSMHVVLFGSLGLIVLLMFIPQLGLGPNVQGLLGAVMILLFGFLFVTVSSRLTGEIGSSSNPISGMTIATLLLTCLIFWLVGRTGQGAMLTALSVAAVVCIASSNGGTTSQDLKTGYLVGATPRYQQLSILVGALTSALVIGGTMLALNAAGTHYTNQDLPTQILKVPDDATLERAGKPHEDDTSYYRVVHVRKDDKLNPNVRPGRYLVDDRGRAAYRADVPISREAKDMDNGQPAPKGFVAPQPRLFATIIQGILGGELEWGLIIIGVLVAFTIELLGVAALPVAVGMYLPISSSTPIFMGGMLRWLSDRIAGKSASEAESETSPGVLLSSGYIAGGTLCGLIIAFFAFLPDAFNSAVNFGAFLPKEWQDEASTYMQVASLVTFAILAVVLVRVGTMRATLDEEPAPGARPPGGGPTDQFEAH